MITGVRLRKWRPFVNKESIHLEAIRTYCRLSRTKINFADMMRTTHELNKLLLSLTVLMTKRSKVSWLCHLQDCEGQIQIYVRKDAVGEKLRIFKKADLGDFLGVEGEIMRTVWVSFIKSYSYHAFIKPVVPCLKHSRT